jgi:periplasmic protein TonB
MRSTAVAMLELLLAAALWSALASGLLRLLEPPATPMSPVVLDARFVEMPAPAPKPAASSQSRVVSQTQLQSHPHSAPTRTTPPRTAAVVHQVDSGTTPAPAISSPPSKFNTDSTSSNATSASEPPAERTATAGEEGAARPLLQPLPVLPDDLREYAYQAIALARFTIHADGSVDVVLTKPTQIPRLNQLLLATLRNWRFFPAMKNGHPVESEQDVRVHFNVD